MEQDSWDELDSDDDVLPIDDDENPTSLESDEVTDQAIS